MLSTPLQNPLSIFLTGLLEGRHCCLNLQIDLQQQMASSTAAHVYWRSYQRSSIYYCRAFLEPWVPVHCHCLLENNWLQNYLCKKTQQKKNTERFLENSQCRCGQRDRHWGCSKQNYQCKLKRLDSQYFAPKYLTTLQKSFKWNYVSALPNPSHLIFSLIVVATLTFNIYVVYSHKPLLKHCHWKKKKKL